MLRTPLSRRALLRRALITAPIALAATSLAARAQTKQSQQTVGYQPSPNAGKSCANCAFYQGDGVCRVVDGQVADNGWCKLHQPKS